MSHATSILDGIQVASPCPVSWDSMPGDERTRSCSQCRKQVFNLSGMSRQEAEGLIREKNGKLCVRYFQRAEGGVMTRDCPGGAPLLIRRALFVMVGFLLMLVAGFVLGFTDDGTGRRNGLFAYQPFRAIMEWLSPPPPLEIIGKIACPPAGAPNPPPQGEIFD